MKSCKFFLLIVIWFSSYELQGQPVSSVFHHLTVEDGLTDGTIRAIAQDNDGFMWFGTLSGLNRFDGYTIKTYQKKMHDTNSISDDYIIDLHFTDDNRLWIATVSGVTIYDLMCDTFIRWYHRENDPQSLPDDHVRSITEDADGNIWIAAGGRFMCYSSHTDQSAYYPPLSERALSAVQDMVFDSKGNLWASSSSGLYVLKQGSDKAILVPLPEEYKGKSIGNSLFGITFDPSGFIWCSGFSGMLFKVQIDTYTVYLIDDLMNEGADQNFSATICADQKGSLWFATRFTGLAMYEPSRDTFIFYKHNPFIDVSVGAPTVTSLFSDRSGMIWVGTAGRGVDRFHPDRQYFTTLYPGVDDKSSLPSGWIRCFTENAQGQLLSEQPKD